MELELKYVLQQIIQQGIADVKCNVLNIGDPLEKAQTGVPTSPSAPVVTIITDVLSVLAIGNYYYKVSAVSSAGKESLATSGNVMAQLTATGKSIQLVITNVTNATSYKIYRGISPNTVKYMDTIAKAIGATTTHIDNGSKGYFTEIFRNIFPNRTDDERANIKTYLNKQPIKVVLADPRDIADLPCITIIRTDESEAPQNIGDFIDEDEDPDDNTKVIEEFGTDFNDAYTMDIWTDNPDIREFIYKILKEIVFINRKYLDSLGLMEQSINGQDQQGIVSQYFPNYVYIASLKLSGKTVLTTPKKYTKIPTDMRASVTPIQ